MSIHSIYNPALEHHQPFDRTITERFMTPEEMARFGVTEFKPAKDTGEKTIKPPSFTPYATTPEKTELLPFEPTKQEVEKEMSPAGRKQTFPHIDKEFIEAAFAAGKTAGQIEREAGMQQGTIYARLKKLGIVNPNTKKVEVVQQSTKEIEQPATTHKSFEGLQSESDADHPIKASWKTFEAPKEDLINNPNHYTSGGIETIDYLQAKLTPEEFAGFCKGNIIKYLSREKHKGGIESLRKAQWYLNRLLSEFP